METGELALNRTFQCLSVAGGSTDKENHDDNDDDDDGTCKMLLNSSVGVSRLIHLTSPYLKQGSPFLRHLTCPYLVLVT